MQNRRALIIGIDKYPNLPERAQLEGCVRDAREVASLLEMRFRFPAGQIKLLLDEQATRDGILAAMAKLTEEVQENDAVVVHYSGHGSQRTAQTEDVTRASLMEETLVAHDSGHDDPHPNQDISSLELRDWIAGLTEKTPNVTLILDCCHSGGIATVRHDGRPAPKVRSVKPDLRQPPNSQRIRLRDMKGPASFIRHVVIAACRDRESAHEVVLGDGSHGALSWNLLQALKSLPDGACPTYRDVFEPVRSQVNDLYRAQEPQLEGVRDRELFGLEELVPIRFLPVQDRRADRILLGGGATSSVAEGSVWTVHPPQARAGAETLGRIEVVEVRGMTATARILEEIQPDAISRWCRAVQETAGAEAGLDLHKRRYRDALALRNDLSRLKGKVDFNLGILKNGKWEPLPDGEEVEEGESLSFGVVSHCDTPLYIYVLDFGLTRNISQVYPVLGVSDPLAPRRKIEIGTLTDRLNLSVPEGAPDEGEEILKLFVATREMDLSVHFQTTHQGPTRGEGRARDMGSTIDPTRGGDDWITIERRFRVKRRPEGRVPGRVTRSGARAMS
jgi:Caspase domain